MARTDPVKPRVRRWAGRALLTLGFLAVVLGVTVVLGDARLRRAFDEALASATPFPGAIDDAIDGAIDGAPAQDARAGATAEDSIGLRVVSFNTWALPIALPGSEKASRLPRIPAAVASLSPDVVALQEVFDPRFQRFMLAYVTGTYQSHESSSCDERLALWIRRNCWGGLLTVSRLPITAQRFQPHEVAERMKADERNGGKGIQITTLATAVGPLDVVNVHLYAGRREEDEGYRLAQVRRLGQMLRDSRSLQRPIVLAGDLNVDHPRLVAVRDGALASAAYAFLVDSLGFVDSRAEVNEDDYTYDADRNRYAGLWYNRWEGRQVFDFVMTRAPAGYSFAVLDERRVVDGDDPLSDHYGVYAELSLTRTR